MDSVAATAEESARVTLDTLLAFAPEGCVDSLMSLCVPMVAAGFGLVMLFWFLGVFWSVVMSVFEID